MITITSSLIKKAKKGVTYDFSSVQILMPPHIAKRCRNWGKKNIPASNLYSDGGSKGREDEMHVTVKYGLHTESPDGVKDIIGGFGSFIIKLGEISRFAKRDTEYDIVKIEILGEKLHRLHHLISDNLKNSDENPGYKPHMTLAYIQSGECYELSGCEDLKGTRIKISELEFSSKNGRKSIISL